jgi:hypothetical protein
MYLPAFHNILPASGWYIPESIFISVVLPEPFRRATPVSRQMNVEIYAGRLQHFAERF